MRNWNVLLLIAALVGGPAWAAEPPANATVLSATGDGNWEVICHVNTSGGDDSLRVLNRSRASASVPGMRGGSCNFTKPSKSVLTISLQSTTLLCPFKSAAADACTQTFEKGGVGSFEIKPKPSR